MEEESILTTDIQITVAHLDSQLKDADTPFTQSKTSVITKGLRTL